MPGPGTWVLPHSIMGTKRRPSSDTRAASDLPPTSFQLLPICQRAVQLGQNPYGTRVIAAHITLRYSQNCANQRVPHGCTPVRRRPYGRRED